VSEEEGGTEGGQVGQRRDQSARGRSLLCVVREGGREGGREEEEMSDCLTSHRAETTRRLTQQGKQDVSEEEGGTEGGQLGQRRDQSAGGCPLLRKRGGRVGGRD